MITCLNKSVMITYLNKSIMITYLNKSITITFLNKSIMKKIHDSLFKSNYGQNLFTYTLLNN